MKRNGKNSSLPTGYALIQEFEARFGTVCDVVDHLLKSTFIVREHLDDNSVKFYSCISTDKNAKNFPGLEAIVSCFKPIRHAQTRLEASTQPTISLILRMLEQLKHELSALSIEGDGIDSERSPHNSFLAYILLTEVEKLRLMTYGLPLISYILVCAHFHFYGDRLVGQIYSVAIRH